MKCPHCEKEITGIPCPECDGESPEGADFCMKCGAELAPPAPVEGGDDAFDLNNRVLCPDGTCTGIIVDGKCSDCGTPYPPKPGAATEGTAEEVTAENGEKPAEEGPEKEAPTDV